MNDRRRAHERLWAISCYFNPLGAPRRLANYREFRSQLTVPLVTVELAYRAEFELNATDADILIQHRGVDVMWQKERLLNLALAVVPNDIEAVAWLDSDIVFDREDWPAATYDALQQFPLVQPFQSLVDLPEGVGLTPASRKLAPNRASLASLLAERRVPPDVFRVRGGSLRWNYSVGHAWAARHALLKALGIYDVRILGSGNKVMASAAYGRCDDAIRAYWMSPPETSHFLRWARSFAEDVDGKVGFVPGTLYHLWHGNLQQRNYAERHRDFARFHFDPYRDIALDENKIWRWSSNKPAMADYVQNYFASRKE